MTPLDRAVDHFGSKAAMARAIGAKPMTVQHWFRGRPVPVAQAIRIEQASEGAIKAAELRPDVFGEPPAAELQEVG